MPRRDAIRQLAQVPQVTGMVPAQQHVGDRGSDRHRSAGTGPALSLPERLAEEVREQRDDVLAAIPLLPLIALGLA